jgi:sugar phosphate isomerase/epimerase
MAMSRRDVLRSVVAAAISAGGPSLSPALWASGPNLRVGLELYTVNDAMKMDFDSTLHRVAAVGYKTVEFPWFYGHSAREVRKSLDAAGLSCKSALFYPNASVERSIAPGEKNLEDDLPQLIEAATIVGLEYMGAVLFPVRLDVNDLRLTEDDYRRAAQFLNRAGEATKKAGIQFTYHNHDFELKDLGGTNGYELLLSLTDAQLVKMEMDVGWVAFAGQDPIHYLTKYPGRFAALHVRDFIKKEPHVRMKMHSVEVGSGVIDWMRVLQAADVAGCKLAYVEQDPADPAASIESASKSFQYLSKLLGQSS